MSGAAELVHVVGVRHHSPACARLVAHAIATRRPKHVLVEGPSDMNGRTDELLLPHAPPIAVYSYVNDGATGRARGVWSPFCAHSPEWIALRAARDVGADARFMDLPAWHAAFAATENRYGDRRGDAARARSDAYLTKLCRSFRLDDTDTLWDHLFELELAGTLGDAGDEPGLARLEARLAVHFDALRFGEPAGDRDGPREAFMTRCLAWAARDAASSGGRVDHGGVVAVCGGWHRPALLEGIARAIDALEPDAAYPDAPPPDLPDDADAANARWGSYLVPYSHKRLDSLAGYASGMPSPGYYGHVWASGAASASERAMTRIARRLRERRQPVSTADLIACRATAEALARMRAHAIVARGDLLDAIAATLVKDALDVEVPWARRGALRKGTDPVLVEVVAELAGDAIGALAKGTPRPPLADDVEAEFARLDLTPAAAPRDVALDLASAVDLPRSRALHRLRVLDVPGFARAPAGRVDRDRATRERWLLARDVDADTRLVEASAYGATLESAARGALEERASLGGGAGALADTLADAIATGLLDFAADVLDRLDASIRSEPSFAEVGAVLRQVLGVLRHGALLVAAGDATLARVAAAAFDRGLWLLEGLGGVPGFPGADVAAVAALRDAARTPRAELDVDAARARAVFERRVADATAHPAIRGACLGAIVSATRGATGAATDEALAALRRTPPKELGDLLAGLFALAREEMLAAPELLRTVDGLLALATPDDFLAALPALRFAFGWFPPRERRVIADRVAALHGLDRSASHELLARVAAPDVIATSARVEATALATARRYGLTDALDAREAT
ncbi:MAG TPA: DUF5682 family protein [Byssovorax sp.]|jgi:hypothetical protein